MPIKLNTTPAVEPVSLAEAKLHLRVDFTDDDTLITMLIGAARVAAENICRRAFITQKWDLYLDAFPRQNFYGVLPGYAPLDQYIPSVLQAQRGYAIRFRGGKIELPFPALQSVEYVKYRDATGTLVTLDPSLYTIDNASEPGVLTPAPDQYWPNTQNIMNAVQIGYTAGYGDATAVPAGIKSWILLRAGALYENREEVAVGQRIVVAELPFIDGLLDPYIIASF
ncbi:head-tail connector protein [Herminiimonas sp. CN]|uniref:head-tail connector protein n=1 Tax=Herminiimonas sp. CN TaxID=1349818 RepID=UPI0004731129|nr:head-tail connector protein [Herminiimonas sp. CN]